MGLSDVIRILTRKKVYTEDTISQTELKRCLSLFDLLTLSIGCTLGVGLYVLTGEVAHEKAGPAVTVSFFVAAFASALAGTCYAEFASRVPRAGSAYVYSYISVGEFIAFVIGWNLVLEYVIGAASVSRAMSAYIDSLLDNCISNYFKSHMPMRLLGLSDYPDLFACVICILAAVLLGSGIQESSMVTQVLTIVNLLVIVYIAICGAFKFDFHNWNLSESEVPSSAGSGGFMPYGFSGMMSGAATCFYAFIGFDVLASAAEEARNPRRDMPIAILGSIFVVFLSYFTMSAVMTLMCPYYMLDLHSAPAEVFRTVGWGFARYVISIGAIACLATCLITVLLPLPRVFYVMGTDGLLFRCLGKVSPRFQTPLNGSIVAGVMSGIVTLFLDLKTLVDMVSIGTLLAYTLVSISVLILRYENGDINTNVDNTIELSRSGNEKDTLIKAEGFSLKYLWSPPSVRPNKITSAIAKCTIWLLCLTLILFSVVAIFCEHHIIGAEAPYILLVIVFVVLIVILTSVLQRQPQNVVDMSFNVPLVPYLPALSLFVNVYLMVKLSFLTWMRFLVWLVVGLAIYFFYGIRHSTLNNTESQRKSGD